MKIKFLKLLLPFVMMICVIAFLSCSPDQAEELFKTAQFEELQNNPEHARQLYNEILNKYPESEYAGKAKDRLSELGK